MKFLKEHKFNHILDLNVQLEFADVNDDIENVLAASSRSSWVKDVNRINAKQGLGQNKLRSYRMFKSDIYTEPYVYLGVKKKYRRSLAMFRAGIAPINLELQRYGAAKQPVENRRCIVCTDKVESECHVLVECPLYEDIRNKFITSLDDIDKFKEMDNISQMCFMLSNYECVRIVARTCYEILERRRVLTIM